MKVVEVREATKPIRSSIRNAYIDFSKMTLSLVAVITDVVRDGKRVVGYGFTSRDSSALGWIVYWSSDGSNVCRVAVHSN